jgi:phosphoglycerate dehydrogenase-like enzyme
MRVVLLDTIWAEALAAMLDPRLSVTIVRSAEMSQRDAALADADILVSARFTADMGRAVKHLRLLVCPAAGTEWIYRDALPDGVVLVKGTGHEIAMAEYIIGSIIALRQRFREADVALRRGEWRYGFYGGDRMLEELYRSNIGFVGFGGIGQEAAKRAATLGMRCAAVTLHPERSRPQTEGLEFLGKLSERPDVDRLTAWSDQLVLCCELSSLTKGMFDARRLALLKPRAVIVNVARGAVAVENDLYDALASGQIAGAALDVWYHYPREPGQIRQPSDKQFQELDNVLMTPHASGWTRAAKQRRLEAMAQAINDFARM